MNVANLQGNTALHEAVRRGHQPLVELLLRGGASPGLRNKRQRTPLDCAYELGGKVSAHTHTHSGKSVISGVNVNSGTPSGAEHRDPESSAESVGTLS